MKKGILFVLITLFAISGLFAEKAAPINYDPADYPAPTRQGGEDVGSAVVITALPFNDSGTTAGYVDDYDEVCPYTGSTSPDVVYSYTPTVNMINGFISLCGDTDYDSKLYIYENEVTPGAPYDCNDDECTSALGQSYVSELTGLDFTAGNTYYIVVDGYSGGSGNYEIDFTADGTGPETPVLFFSEYIEGSSNNKALEIFNNSGDVVSLDEIRINQSVNGGGWEYQHTFPAGATLADGDVWVIITDQTDPALYDPAEADEVLSYPSVVHHNGDDARGLEYSDDGGATWTLIDVIGVPTEDPGDGWEVAGIADATQNHTLVRKAEVTIGNTDWAISAGTNAGDSEWTVYPEDTFDYLGQHPGMGGGDFNPPQNVAINAATQTLTWEAPVTGGEGEWIGWDSGVNDNAIGLTSGGTFSVASHWDPSDLTAYDGYEFTTMMLYPNSDARVSFTLKVWTGPDAGTEILSQDYAGFTFNEFNEVVLNTPIIIDASQELWFGYEVTHDAGEFPAGCDPGPAVAGYGDMISMDGVSWDPLSSFGLNYNWNLQAYIVAPDGRQVVLSHDKQKATQVATVNQNIDIFSSIRTQHQAANVNRDLTGYNVYLDGVVVASNIADLSYTYDGLNGGQYYLAGVSAVYDDPGESEVIELGFTVPGSDFDPPQNVIVDDELGILSWDPPSSPLIEDDMESYTVGGYLALQSDLWTTWSNAPGGAEDAFVSDDQANSGTQSTLVELNQDLVFIMEDYTAGVYSYEMSMYVPSGYCGYFNLQKTSTPGEEWALQIYYQTDGTALGDAAAAGAITHTFNHDEWMDIKVVVDLDNDWATYYFNGDEIFGYQWTLGTFGTPGLLAFGGANIFGGANSTTTDTPMYYFDDVILSEIVPARDLTGYNVYLDNAFVEYTTATTYTYSGLVEDQAYIAGVSAVYDDPGESDVVSVNFVYNPETDFDPPENLTASISDYNTVDLAWEAPGGITAEWIGWDNGENGNAIGLTSGGTFSVASHWDPADLTDYDGAQITQIMFFPNSDARVNFTLKIWTGANAGTEVVSQDVTGFTFNEFNTVEINDTFIIDASTELWFGYEVTHDAGEFPAGCDPGPAVAGYGDMISMDGATWDPLSGFGLDYNWNLQAYLMSSDGQAMTFSNYEKSAPSIKRVNLSNNPFSVIVTESTISRETRSLAGYKIYRDGSEVGEVTDPNVLVFSEEGLDAGTYDYTVTAIYTNPDGESIDSNIAEAVVELPAPINLTATVNMPDVLLQWDDPVRGIESFNIYRDDEVVGTAVGTAGFYVDPNVPNGTHIYNVTAVYTGGFESEYSNDAEAPVSGDGILIPLVTELTGNNPNPFNPETSINFSLNKTDNVSIQIYNLKGQLVKTLVDGELNAAWHSIVWNGTDVSDKQVSSGVYFYKMHTSDYTSIKKMILLK